jgi:hypothetical protein
MSILDEKKDFASKEEIIEYLKRRIEELENELKILRTILARYEPAAMPERFDPNEKLEDVKVGRKTIARIGVGEDYVRAIFRFQTGLPSDIRSYLERISEEIADKQALEGIPPEERTKLEVKEYPEGLVRELSFTNLYGPLERVKAKAALKYAVELLYQLSKKQKSSDTPEED